MTKIILTVAPLAIALSAFVLSILALGVALSNRDPRQSVRASARAGDLEVRSDGRRVWVNGERVEGDTRGREVKPGVCPTVGQTSDGDTRGRAR